MIMPVVHDDLSSPLATKIATWLALFWKQVPMIAIADHEYPLSCQLRRTRYFSKVAFAAWVGEGEGVLERALAGGFLGRPRRVF
jgi:hypothetical protein